MNQNRFFRFLAFGWRALKSRELVLLSLSFFCAPLLSFDRLMVEELKYAGPPAEKWIVSGIRGTLTNDLRRLASNYEVLTVDDQNTALKMAMERRKAGEKINIAEETARILKVDYRCVGEVQNVGKDVRVTLKLLKAPDFEIYKSSTTDKKRTELLELQNLLAQNLLQDVDEKISPSANKSSNTKSPEAYEYYSKGMSLLYENPSQALGYFEKAIQIDPNYIDPMIQAGTILVMPITNYPKAMDYLGRAKLVLESTSKTETVEYANVLGLMGLSIAFIDYNTYGDARYFYNNDKADKYFVKSIGILERLGLETSDTYYKIKLYLYTNRKEDDRIIELISTMENFGKSSPILLTVTISALIFRLIDRRDNKNALYYAQKDVEMLEGNGCKNTYHYGNSLANLAYALWQNQIYNDRYLNSLNQAKAIFDRIQLQNSRNNVELLTLFGIYYINTNNKSLAKKYFQQAKQLRIKIGSNDYKEVIENSLESLE